MASTIEEIEAAIQQAISTGFRGRLLDRGLARSMIWSDGILPNGSPNFADELSYDLLSFGYSLLSLGLRLRELNGDADLCRAAFEKAATAITDVVHNGNPNDPEKGFHKVLSASAFHLGRFSAKAFSVIHDGIANENLSRMERMLSLLILRQFENLETSILEWKKSALGSDEVLANKLEADIAQFFVPDAQAAEYDMETIELPVVNLAIEDNYFSSIFEFLFALETGSPVLQEGAIRRIDDSLSISAELGLLPQWWVLRLTKHLLNDLWESSFHTVIPVTPDHEHGADWALLRWLYIASLFKRDKSEIDLWPSQLDGATRAVSDLDDLVVSLPTSAGKTRVAELCILRCLAIGKRVLFITPLRALSAQTETSLRKTFLPLGKSVSSLYGSMGTSDFEQDVLKTQDIVVGTPEKLDFALRNEPSLIDDVGLVVLDEGHMIGLNEREISYEVQIQRLLRREDADSRRIVCLSAILPDGEQLEDFVSWLRRDKDGDAIQSNWRPTDLRFGEVIWQTNSGRLNFIVGEEGSFIPGYIQPMVPPLPNPGYRRKEFPCNSQELTLATAWKLTQDDHTVLIYCPLKVSVNAFAKAIIDLHKRGALDSVLSVPEEKIELARILGKEWLGNEHPIIECLSIGVAIHHGGLPTPFRKEMESLLREGILKITVSSPTLAQGLNLTATAVIVYSLSRNRKLIEASEFKNVVGRAGRAFVDTHGLVLHPIYDDIERNKGKWHELVNDVNARNMESGLVRLILTLLQRMAEKLGTNDSSLILNYVLNNAAAWEFPEVDGENENRREETLGAWNRHIVSLDTALLSLIGEEDISIDELSVALDTVLQSSLWQRRLARHEEGISALFNSALVSRARYIWGETTALQRKGYYLAGLGLTSGMQLDAISNQANALLINANAYIAANDRQSAINAITQLAELLFTIPPFIPSNMPEDWKEILEAWLDGETLTDNNFSDIDAALAFVEDGLIYRLPWGMEAIRVRAQANEDIIQDDSTIDDYEIGLVVPAVESGTLNRSAALLMQAGFNSRQAAIQAVQSTNATFTNSRQLKSWINSNDVFNLAIGFDWPTPETSDLWWKFVNEFQPASESTWGSTAGQLFVEWIPPYTPVPGEFVKLRNSDEGNTQVLGSSGECVGSLDARYRILNDGIYYSSISQKTGCLSVTFWGVSEEPFQIEAEA